MNFTALATQTEGYSATDLKDLVARAVHRAAIRVAKHVDEEEYQVSHSSLRCQFADSILPAYVDYRRLHFCSS